MVLNRNNSADRLEAATPLPESSPLTETLRGAEPRSCLAVRSDRTHLQSTQKPALLACPVCVACPGSSACVPLTDLDHFKQVNDQRGHAVGDQVLANVGAALYLAQAAPAKPDAAQLGYFR